MDSMLMLPMTPTLTQMLAPRPAMVYLLLILTLNRKMEILLSIVRGIVTNIHQGTDPDHTHQNKFEILEVDPQIAIHLQRETDLNLPDHLSPKQGKKNPAANLQKNDPHKRGNNRLFKRALKVPTSQALVQPPSLGHVQDHHHTLDLLVQLLDHGQTRVLTLDQDLHPDLLAVLKADLEARIANPRIDSDGATVVVTVSILDLDLHVVVVVDLGEVIEALAITTGVEAQWDQ